LLIFFDLSGISINDFIQNSYKQGRNSFFKIINKVANVVIKIKELTIFF